MRNFWLVNPKETVPAEMSHEPTAFILSTVGTILGSTNPFTSKRSFSMQSRARRPLFQRVADAIHRFF